MLRSYAQNFEDVILHRALKTVQNGFYIDIGAQDPVTDSVSLAFYELGWRGVHVEPHHVFSEKLRLARPDETILELAVGARSGVIQFFVTSDTGLSTANPEIAESNSIRGYPSQVREVKALKTSELLDRYKNRDIHWLKIDVEGFEKEVIEGWLPSNVRPWIVVVEATKPMTAEPSHAEWDPLLVSLGYDFVYFDGLNRFYVSHAHSELKASFGIGPNVFDGFYRVDATTALVLQTLERENRSLAKTLADHGIQEPFKCNKPK
jgi:FkbM family methyltransferase